MTVPNWTWPASGARARGIALIPFGASGLAVADWTVPKLWPFSGGAFAAPVALSGSPYGLCGAAADGTGGAWAASWDGIMYHVASGGALLSQATMPSGQAYAGAAFCPGDGGFALSAPGGVYGSGGALVGSFPVPARTLAASGATLAALLPGSGVAAMAAAGGATGLIGFPPGIATLSAMAMVSGAQLAVAGWNPALPLSGAAAAAMDPQDPTRMLAVGSGFALQWKVAAPYADSWAQVQAISGLADLVSVAWSPDGTQALACDPASGAVQALAYAVGSVSLAQTLAVSGACSAAVAGDAAHALVAQSGQAQAATLTYTGSWASGTPVGGLAGIAAVAAWGPSGAVAAVSGGLQYLNLLGGVWSSGGTVPLGFAPAALAVDPFLQVYAAGSGAVAMASGAALVASGTWSGGAAMAVAVQQGRIVIAVPSDGLLRVFGLSASGALTQQTATPLASGATGLGLSSATLFAMQPSGTATYGFSGAPYALTPVLSGAVALWDGSSWTTAGLGLGNTPTAVGIGASGDAWVATIQNTLWHLSSGAAVISSGALEQYPGQAQTVPLCPSALTVASGGVWVATSIPGVLEQAA